jgi:hypothetical protein
MAEQRDIWKIEHSFSFPSPFFSLSRSSSSSRKEDVWDEKLLAQEEGQRREFQ